MSGGKPIGFLVNLLEPTIFVIAISSLYVLRHSDTAQTQVPIPPIGFAVSGYCVFWACRFQINKSITALSINLPLLYHRDIKIFDLLVSRAIVQACFNTFAFLIIFFIVWFFDLIPSIRNFLLVTISWIFVLWYGGLFAMICGILGAAFSFGNRIVALIGISHIFLTGAFFMLAWIPEGYRKILLLFPMVHATEMMRDGLFGDFVETYYSVGYLLAANIVLTYIALVIINVYKRHEGVYGKLF